MLRVLSYGVLLISLEHFNLLLSIIRCEQLERLL